MKWIEKDEKTGLPCVELTRRNLLTLLAKLTDLHSAHTLIDGDNKIAVRSVEDEEHYKARQPGEIRATEDDFLDTLHTAKTALARVYYSKILAESDKAVVGAALNKVRNYTG